MTDLPKRLTTKNVTNAGSTSQVRVTGADLDKLGLNIGDEVKVLTYEDRIIIEPVIQDD